MIGRIAAGEGVAERQETAPGDPAPVDVAPADPATDTGAFVIPEGIEPAGSRLAFVPWAAAILSVAWLAAMAWLARGSVSVADPVALAQFVATLCAVPALLGIAWLVAARADHAHAARLVAGAREMRAESHELARTVAQLAATMAANRDALAEQTRALTTLGDGAAARLAQIGRGLSEEIDQADIHARALGEAAAAAEARVAALLATMPRAQAEAETLGAMVEQVGMGAGVQMAALDAQLAALAAKGREAETVAGGAAQKLAAHIARMDGTTEAAGARLDAVAAAVARDVDALLDRTATAIDQSRQGIAAQGDAMLAMVGANQAALDSAARDSAEALAERIEIVELVIDRVAKRLEAQRVSGDAMVTTLDSWIDRAETRFDTLHDQGTRKTEALAAAIGALNAHADAMTESLKLGDTAALTATATIETLLIALDSATREMDETLPGSLERLDTRLDRTRQLIAGTRPDLLALVTAAESTHDAVEAVAGTIAAQRSTIDQVNGDLARGLATGRDQGVALETTIQGVIDRVDGLAEEAAPRLLEALLRVRDTAVAAADKARETLAEVIPEAATALEMAGSAALHRAAGSAVEAQIAAVAEVAEAAVAAATRAADRLEEQVARIGERSAEADARFAAAHAAHEADETETFGRRASLLVEALNSAAIDLTGTLAPEITDAAWGAYLKGDRGVFTRRAVRLLDASQAREVARLYEEDDTFRARVNRYVHDFESMLRAVLAQRDGSPLGITLLSSDMGKLYVALAQAIERLR